jgi:hypothetical protein
MGGDGAHYDAIPKPTRARLSGLELLAVPPEDILLALTKAGMPCTVPEPLTRFRSFVEERTKGKDTNKVRIVMEW